MKIKNQQLQEGLISEAVGFKIVLLVSARTTSTFLVVRNLSVGIFDGVFTSVAVSAFCRILAIGVLIIIVLIFSHSNLLSKTYVTFSMS